MIRFLVLAAAMLLAFPAAAQGTPVCAHVGGDEAVSARLAAVENAIAELMNATAESAELRGSGVPPASIDYGPPQSIMAEEPQPQELRGMFGNNEARRAILEVAGQELRPLQVARLRLAMAMRPVKTQAAIDMVVLNSQAQGLVSEDGEIAEAADWSAILKIILELLPLILKLFGL